MTKKKRNVDGDGRHHTVFEKSLALSLGLFLLVFLTWHSVEIKAFQGIDRQNIIVVEDIPQTRHVKLPPPPARPVVPIESESEELPEDVTVQGTDLETFQSIDLPLPPPDVEPPMEFWHAEVLPKLIHFSVPEYPTIAKKAGLECVVFVQILVDEKGNPVKVKVAKPCGNVGFNEAAEEAAWKCTFTPGKQNDKPVRVWVSLPFRFELK